MRLTGKVGTRAVYRLYLQGKATPLTTETPGFQPALEVKRSPSGLIYGKCFHVESGAYLVSYSLAFLKLGKGFWSLPDYEVVRANGKTALLQETQPGIWSGGRKAKWFDGQRLIDIGPSDASYLPSPGVVRGYYHCDDTGQPVRGMFSEFRTAIYRQYFEWKAGVRLETGRKEWRKAVDDGGDLGERGDGGE
jgi:hypothetical protein